MIVDLHTFNINQNQNQHLALKVLTHHAQNVLGTPQYNLLGTSQTTQ